MKATPVLLLMLVIYGCSGFEEVPEEVKSETCGTLTEDQCRIQWFKEDIDVRSQRCKPHESQYCVDMRKRADKWLERKEERCPDGFILFKVRESSRCVSQSQVRRMLKPM